MAYLLKVAALKFVALAAFVYITVHHGMLTTLRLAKKLLLFLNTLPTSNRAKSYANASTAHASRIHVETSSDIDMDVDMSAFWWGVGAGFVAGCVTAWAINNELA